MGFDEMLRFLRRSRWDDERAREMQAHIEIYVDELVERGVSPAAARQQALREFGNRALIKEEIYQMNSIPVLETVARDLKYAVRTLRKSPGFTLTAVATLSLAIAINTAVFSIVDAVLLRPLPYSDPDRLLLLQTRTESASGTWARTAQTGTGWVTLRDNATTVDRAVFSTWVSGVNVVAGDHVTHADQQRVGAGFFRVLGVKPAFGREFSDDEDRGGGPAVVVLGHDFWRSSLGGDPSIVGNSIMLRGETHTVVGIMPATTQTGVRADLWTPLRAGTTGEGEGENYQVLLRRRPEASQQQVDAEIARIGLQINQLSRIDPDVRVSYGTVPLQRGLTETLRRPLTMLWAAVGVVLLIACVNLAGLLLARSARRSREIATRLALGSGRAAVIRQLLVESLVLAVVGGILGVLASGVMLEGLRTLATNAMDLWQPIALDARAMTAGAVFAVLATAIFGLAPALQASRVNVRGGMDGSSGRTVAGTASRRTRHLVIVTQVALGVVLLAGAGLLVRTFTHLRGLEPGFDGRNVHAATVSLQDARYTTSAQVLAFADTTLRSLRQSPGVEAAAISLGLPYERLLNIGFRHLDGPQASAERGRMTTATYVTPDYFTALRIPLRAGRVFDERDSPASPSVVVVNETIAREYFDGENPVGRRIRLSGADREIVGVVGDVQLKPSFGNYGPLGAVPLVYMPLTQTSAGMLRQVHVWFGTSIIVRAQGTAGAIVPVMRAAVDAADPMLPFAQVRSMSEVQAEAMAMPRLMMSLLLTLAGAAVALAAVGIHGLISSSVTERTREMGIRMALGATTARAVRTVALPGVVLAAVGIVIGAIASRGATTLIESFVFGVRPTDPATYTAVAALFIAVAVIASVLPALRILRLDPAKTLRAE